METLETEWASDWKCCFIMNGMAMFMIYFKQYVDIELTIEYLG
jgi:hypothetical protein